MSARDAFFCAEPSLQRNFHSSHSEFHSELEMNLTLQLSTSSLGIDLAERTRVNVQIGISGGRMVEYIASIHTQRQSFRLRNLDRLQDIRVEAPHSRSGERIKSERSELSRRGISQDNFSVGIRKRGESAKGCER